MGVPLHVLATTKYLILDLFTGMDGLGHALESLGISDLDALHVTVIFFETDSRCRQLLRARRVKSGAYLSDVKDSTGEVGSVFALTDADFFYLGTLINSCPLLRVFFVGGGSPCVGFSQANPGGRGIDDPASNMIWTIPVIATKARELISPDTAVVFFLENVDMHPSRRPPLDQTLGVPGVKACASLYLPCRRPREYWTNLESHLPPELCPDLDAVLDDGWRPLWELLARTTSSSRFGTFLRPFSAGHPREFPASYCRLPLSMYSEQGLVYRPDSPPRTLEKIKELVARCCRCNTSDLKESGGRSVKLRGELCDWIHLKGGSEWLRPLNGRERDLALGFPSFASALPGEETESSITWGRLEASGNSFAVPVIAALVKPLATAILSGIAPPLLPGFPSTPTASAALAALGASSSTPLAKENRRR